MKQAALKKSSNYLQSVLHEITSEFTALEKGEFSLILNAYTNSGKLLYLGAAQQRRYLEGVRINDELTPLWEELETLGDLNNFDGLVSKQVLKEESSSNKITFGTLKSYFSDKKGNRIKAIEYELLNEYFSISRDRYISFRVTDRLAAHLIIPTAKKAFLPKEIIEELRKKYYQEVANIFEIEGKHLSTTS